MNLLRQLIQLVVAIVKAVLFDWLRALAALVREWLQRCALGRAKQRLPGRLNKAAREGCVSISDPAYKRPDPLIYSQLHLLSQGLAVTWNNPDIQLERAGVPVSSNALLPNTEYDIVARIWNGSMEAPIVGLPVTFSFLDFGAGALSNPIGRTHVNLGVKGGANHPAFARVKWRTPAKVGHYCLRAQFEWLDDLNPDNNLGQENTTVVEAHSPATFTFTLRNDARDRHRFRFEVDAYTLPARPICPPPVEQPGRPKPAEDAPLRTRPGRIRRVPAEHDRNNHPLPPGWTVAFNPEHPVLDHDEAAEITVTVTPPASFAGTRPLNVHVFHENGPAGGVTVEVKKS